jgi:hypothetical protein
VVEFGRAVHFCYWTYILTEWLEVRLRWCRDDCGVRRDISIAAGVILVILDFFEQRFKVLNKTSFGIVLIWEENFIHLL